MRREDETMSSYGWRFIKDSNTEEGKLLEQAESLKPFSSDLQNMNTL
jgi:hypothetical protein